MLVAAASSTYLQGSSEASIYNQLNAVRVAGNFGALTQSRFLDASARNHAKYLVTNYFTIPFSGLTLWDTVSLFSIDPSTGNLNAHIQSPLKPDYTGITANDRARFAGYNGSTSEVVAFNSKESCLASFLNTVFHRGAILSPSTSHVGIGIVSTSSVNDNACVITTSNERLVTLPSNWVGFYPAKGQQNVLIQMNPEEPNPAPEVAYANQGSPVTIYADKDITSIQEFTLTNTTTNVAVPVKSITSANFASYVQRNEAHILPTQALSYNTTYRVSFKGAAGGRNIIEEWTFKTIALN